MKRIAFIAAALFVGLGLSLWLVQSYEINWEPHLRSYLENEATRRLRIPVHIEQISLSLKGNIVLHHVWVTDPANPADKLFEAHSIDISSSLLDLPGAVWRRSFSESIGAIAIRSPHLHLNSTIMNLYHGNRLPSHSLPLWLTLIWEDGSIEWPTAKPSPSTYTLFQSHGIFRIRGPKNDLFLSGSSRGLSNFRFHYSLFRHRWSADAEIIGLEWESIEKAWEHFTGTNFLPSSISVKGKADFALQWHGTGPVGAPQSWSAVQEGRITFQNTLLHLHPYNLILEPIGTLRLRNTEISLSDLILKEGEKYFACKGLMKGFPHAPELDLTVKNTHSQWPFEKLEIRSRWLNNHWEFLQNRAYLTQGTVDAKGWASADQLDIQLTGQDISLSHLADPDSRSKCQGKLQAALTVQGTPQDPHWAGTLWVEGLSWDRLKPENVQGDLEWASEHFHMKLLSPDSQFSIQAEGSNKTDRIGIEKIALRLRNGTLLLAEGSFNKTTRFLDLPFHTSQLKLSRSKIEIPLQGHLTGPLNDLSLYLSLTMEGISTKAFLRQHLSTGTFRISDKNNNLSGSWYAQMTHPDLWELQSQSHLVSTNAYGWDLPIHLSGQVNLTQTTRISAAINVSEPQYQHQVLAPFHAVLNWNDNFLTGEWKALGCRGTLSARQSTSEIAPIHVEGKVLQGGHFEFEGRVPLDSHTLEGEAHLHAFNLKTMAETLGLPQPLEGLAQGTLSLQGNSGHWQLSGQLEGGPISYGKPDDKPIRIQSYNLKFLLLPPGADRTDTLLTITQGIAKTIEEEVRLTPQSQVIFSGKHEGRFKLGTEIRNLHLGWLTLFGGLDAEGSWKIEPAGFHLDGIASTRSLYLNDYELQEGKVHLNYYNRMFAFMPVNEKTTLIQGGLNMQQAPQVIFNDFAISGQLGERLNISGEMGPSHWDFRLQGKRLDLHTLGGLAGFPYSLDGIADLNIRGTGNTDYPNLSGEAKLARGQIMGLHYQDGYADFLWQGQRMTLTQLSLSDPGRFTLLGTGTFPLTRKDTTSSNDRSIDFSVRLVNSNLGLLQSLFSEIKEARGDVQGFLHATGSIENPQFAGSLQVRYGDIVQAHYFRRLKDFYLTADFSNNQLFLREFRGRSGEGRFEGKGVISFSGFLPKFYDLTLNVPSTKGIEVQIPELAIPQGPLSKRLKFMTTSSLAEVKGNVEYKGSADAPIFSGIAEISNGRFTFPPSTKNPPPPAFSEYIRKIFWDVRLKFLNGVWFENELLQANLLGTLQLKGPGEMLRVDGGMDITSGSFSYLGIDFDIRQARYDVRSSASDKNVINIPYVRGTGESHVQSIDPLSGGNIDDTITLLVDYAPVEEIKPRLVSSSNPTLSQEKVLARLTQLDVENLTPQERTYLYQQQIVRLLDTTLATPLARNLLKRTGLVDEFRVSRVINPANAPSLNTPVDPNQQQNSTVNLLSGTKYTVAKNISNRLSLGYGLRFEQITTQELQNKLDLRSDVELSYRMMSNVYLKGSFDLPSSTPGVLPERRVTIEPRWRFGWWGNTNDEKRKKSPAQSN